MKYIIILGDGMADYPMERLGGKTPLMAANTPHIDRLCLESRTGLLKTIPEDMPAGSEVANLAVLGYDVHKVYQGRGVLEAASMGVEVGARDLALRCNLICIDEDGKIKNHSAGHISSEEGAELIERLNHEFGDDKVRFHAGVSYRHLLLIKDGSADIQCTPPHDVPGTYFRDVLVRPTSKMGAKTANLINDLILASHGTLHEHPVNRARRDTGKDMATSIWPWAQGYKPRMKTLNEQYGLTGAVISAVDLVQGIGVYAGMEPIHVEGATGLYDTNYEGKTRAALDALKRVDLVYLHIEASDEAGHEGDADLKIKTIEYLDQRVVKTVLEETDPQEVAIALLPDHPTPCEIRTHVRDAVPFAIRRADLAPDDIKTYDEASASKGAFGTLEGGQFMRTFLGRD